MERAWPIRKADDQLLRVLDDVTTWTVVGGVRGEIVSHVSSLREAVRAVGKELSHVRAISHRAEGYPDLRRANRAAGRSHRRALTRRQAQSARTRIMLRKSQRIAGPESSAACRAQRLP